VKLSWPQGAVGGGTREKRQVGLPLAEHVGIVAQGIVAEGPRQAGQHHMLPGQLMRSRSLGRFSCLNVVAVGARPTRSQERRSKVAQVYSCSMNLHASRRTIRFHRATWSGPARTESRGERPEQGAAGVAPVASVAAPMHGAVVWPRTPVEAELSVTPRLLQARILLPDLPAWSKESGERSWFLQSAGADRPGFGTNAF